MGDRGERDQVERDHQQTTGGAAVRGESPSIKFANTRYSVRGQLREGIGTPEELSGWLAAESLALGLEPGAASIGEREVAAFLGLRAAVRSVLRTATEGQAPAPEDIAVLNAAAATVPSWPELTVSGDTYAVVERTGGGYTDSALAALARDAIAVLGGSLRPELRACHAPGCTQFFVREHPRQEWCGPACGNRARAARHYRKQRAV
ncbi:CGNR zinc finger domain-containing protein [Kitasatospora kazusensis]|uniref:CGNR zinc finger domain-containing protein n=1 Tax=Kitasatospora kazusensis TaxID=407974 RepID=A0ABN2Z0V0_9ACTN